MLDTGIDVHILKPDTIIFVWTTNSLYKIVKGSEDKYDITVQGTKRFPKPTKVNFPGSSFGGTMLRVGWIGYMMCMEFHVPGKIIRTSGVKGAKIIGDDWEYMMEWA